MFIEIPLEQAHIRANYILMYETKKKEKIDEKLI